MLQWTVDQKVMKLLKYNYIKEIFHHLNNQPKKKKKENWIEMFHVYKIQD